MRAAWYERQGPACEVLAIGDIEIPEPDKGEVRVRLTFSGVNPGDIKKRAGWPQGARELFPLLTAGFAMCSGRRGFGGR